MPKRRNKEPLANNCSNCHYKGYAKTITKVRMDVCTNPYSKESGNQVDKYCHCSNFKPSIIK